MLKKMAVFAAAVILALAVLGLSVSTKSTATAGSRQVDARHSAAQLITDGTTNYGKTKLDYTLGFGRVNGSLTIDDADPTKSSVVFRFYPANGMEPAIAENGKFLSQWLMNQANQTLVCFHSNSVKRTTDGRLQATGDLTVTRVDRNIEANPTEAYSGPVYGPPMIHRVSREATFVFDLSAADNGQKDSPIQASASTNVNLENFPQLVKAVVATNWPPVVEDEKCQAPANVSEDYRGFRCTGMFMQASGLPPGPITQIGEDYSGPPSNFNAVVGSHLNILLHLRLMAQASGQQAAGVN